MSGGGSIITEAVCRVVEASSLRQCVGWWRRHHRGSVSGGGGVITEAVCRVVEASSLRQCVGWWRRHHRGSVINCNSTAVNGS